MVLGDRFPKRERLASVRRQLTLWRGVRVFCEFTSPPKDKLLVIGRVGPDVQVLVINSRLSNYILARPELKRCQVRLDAADHTFLGTDSFLNCGEVYLIGAEDVERQLVEDMSRIRGEVSAQVRSGVLEAIRASRTLARQQKGQLLSSLGRPEQRDAERQS
jgi:hypothetical protein